MYDDVVKNTYIFFGCFLNGGSILAMKKEFCGFAYIYIWTVAYECVCTSPKLSEDLSLTTKYVRLMWNVC